MKSLSLWHFGGVLFSEEFRTCVKKEGEISVLQKLPFLPGYVGRGGGKKDRGEFLSITIRHVRDCSTRVMSW